MIILGVESSCDETAAAICSDNKILSSVVSSQVIHIEFGGVVPELASREHEKLLNSIVDKAIKEASLTLSDLEGISVTQGPGLAGTLLAGVCFSKGLAHGLNIPIIGVNHLEAHIFANFLADPELEFPFICLLVSGGHTQIWLVKDMGKYELLGSSRDDAAGEAFDKGARILGLGYPGGPAIEKLAKNGDPKAVDFPRAFYNDDTIEYSFSGLKTALLYFMDSNNDEVSKEDVSASYQQAIIDVLVKKLLQGATDKNFDVNALGFMRRNNNWDFGFRSQIRRDIPKSIFLNQSMSLRIGLRGSGNDLITGRDIDIEQNNLFMNYWSIKWATRFNPQVYEDDDLFRDSRAMVILHEAWESYEQLYSLHSFF